MKWLCLLAWLLSSGLNAATVVVHNDVSINSLTQAQLRSIFTMRQIQWPDGSPVYVLVLPDDNLLHQQFSREKLRLFPYQLASIWDKLSFSGTGSRPQVVADETEMQHLLLTVPGSIGYVQRYQPDSGIKEVRIE
ncbi:hypothetical protein [Rheinheimera maricola]|uniref:PBP domain-containing protein n=1 Tax=Rheinheimera maricola TaxID=2793282 RepID=A0ABS7XCW1_9GAMM|nr:hypothetical protein [Rheinheimera maricola]MBZ9613388.1 hypothetical protein [Rheinheimera maricola]